MLRITACILSPKGMSTLRMSEKKDFENGDRIVWHYEHALGGGSYKIRAKVGKFIVVMKDAVSYSGDLMARVKFDGNKGYSKVPLHELQPEHVCEKCGCTDTRACPGGCTWATEKRCSRCVDIHTPGTQVASE